MRRNVKHLNEILEYNILKIFEAEDIDISDKNLMNEMMIIAKEVYCAG